MKDRIASYLLGVTFSILSTIYLIFNDGEMADGIFITIGYLFVLILGIWNINCED